MGYETFKHECQSASELTEYAEKDTLMERWLKRSSGRWGSEGSEPEPHGFPALEMALEEVWPDISILQYQRICRTLVHYSEINDNDWYSERVYYMKYINLEDLYEYMKSWGAL